MAALTWMLMVLAPADASAQASVCDRALPPAVEISSDVDPVAGQRYHVRIAVKGLADVEPPIMVTATQHGETDWNGAVMKDGLDDEDEAVFTPRRAGDVTITAGYVVDADVDGMPLTEPCYQEVARTVLVHPRPVTLDRLEAEDVADLRLRRRFGRSWLMGRDRRLSCGEVISPRVRRCGASFAHGSTLLTARIRVVERSEARYETNLTVSRTRIVKVRICSDVIGEGVTPRDISTRDIRCGPARQIADRVSKVNVDPWNGCVLASSLHIRLTDDCAMSGFRCRSAGRGEYDELYVRCVRGRQQIDWTL